MGRRFGGMGRRWGDREEVEGWGGSGGMGRRWDDGEAVKGCDVRKWGGGEMGRRWRDGGRRWSPAGERRRRGAKETREGTGWSLQGRGRYREDGRGAGKKEVVVVMVGAAGWRGVRRVEAEKILVKTVAEEAAWEGGGAADLRASRGCASMLSPVQWASAST